MTIAKQWPLKCIVDLERYPLTDLASATGNQFVARCRARFGDQVCCALPGFILPDALTTMIASVEEKERHAHRRRQYKSAYSAYKPIHDEAATTLEADDPHLIPLLRDVHFLGYDEFGDDSVLRTLYEAPELSAFAAAVLGVPQLFHAADPLMAAPISLHYEGSELGWHCDTQEFTITVMLRPSESGGKFQYFPEAGPRDRNFDRVPELLKGDEEDVRDVAFEAGTVILFRGANTLHRVTRTYGKRPRILSIFHFERTPGRIYDDQFKMDTFGRVT
jgi:hypothetical protein